MEKSKNPVILNVIRRRQNPVESTAGMVNKIVCLKKIFGRKFEVAK
jgi:hypothetical protein